MPAEDPMVGGEDPNAMGGDAAADPMAGSEMGGAETPVDDDSTEGIISQLSDDDKDAVRNYAKSLLKRDEAQNNPEETDMGGMEEPAAAPAPAGQGIMMEISKGRLKKVQKALQEKFRDTDSDETRNERIQKKVAKNRGKKSPFDSPLD